MAQKGLTVGRAGSHVGNDQVGGVFRPANTVVELSTGAFNFTGHIRNLLVRVPLGAGSFTLTGYDIEVSGTQTIAVDAGVFTVTGHALGLLQRIPLSAGAFTLTGNDVGVKQIVPLSTGSYAVTGNDLGIKQIIPLGAGSYTVTGHDIEYAVNYFKELAEGQFTVTGNDVVLKQIIPLGAGEFLTTGYDIDVVLGTPPSTGVVGTRVPSMWYKRIREQREKDTARQKVLADIEMDAILMACATIIDEEEATWLV